MVSMNNNYYIRKILDDSQIEYISNLIHISNQENYWQDGLKTTGGKSYNQKFNKELSDSDICIKINDCIMKNLDNDYKFLDFTCAKTTCTNIISKSESGNYYNPHLDSWENGDYSTTVFLNSPDEYDGGELCLYFGNDTEKKIKLKSGWAVTYPTGILHRVNTIKSGVRYASVFWTKSHIKDSNIRSINYELSILISLLEENSIVDNYETFESVLKSPLFVANNIKNNLLRIYADK
jgi:PKHD-type hydroxylase